MLKIDQISEQSKKSPYCIDNFSIQYKSDYNDVIFTSPSLELLEKNLYYLLMNSTTKKFDKKYRMKPSYLAYDEYGTIILDKIIMYVNGVMSIEDFDLDVVLVPSIESINEVCRQAQLTKTDDDVEAVEW